MANPKQKMSKELPNQQRGFKGIWIPKEIWLNTDLTPIEKLLIVEVDSLDNDDAKGCYASNEYFGNFFGMTEGRIANMISSLKKRGYLFQVFFDGRNRGLRVHKNVKAGITKDGNRLHEKVKAGFTKRGKQISRKREHNNTVNNPSNNPERGKGKKSAALTPAPALPAQIENELDAYINHVESKKEKAPQVAPPPPLIVTTHNQPQDGVVVTVVEKIELPSPDAPHYYQPTNPDAAAKLMAGLGRTPLAETADEAGAMIESWCKDNIETVKLWYSRSKRAFSPDDLTALTTKFCGCYSNHAETGKQTRFMGDPVLFFRNGFSSWLIEQKKYDVAPSSGGATRYQTTQKGPNNFGSDPDKYLEKQAF